MQFINFGFNFVVMFRLVSPQIKKVLLAAIALIAITISYCFKYNHTEQDWLIWANRCFAQSYDPSADTKLKKWELTVTGDSFIRLRKTYAKGKVEYYSFNLHDFNDMDYLGDSYTGILKLKTIADDIIVQTKNDRAGDVDSMTTVLNIPVKNMGAERLDSLQQAFSYFKTKGL